MPQLSFDDQEALIARCIDGDIDLAVELRQCGLTYDALRYRSNKPTTTAPKSVGIDDLRKNPSGVPTVSVFSGCGGLDLGLEAAGFEHVALVDCDALFCDTLRKNRPAWRVLGPPACPGDVSDVDGVAATLEAAGIAAPFDGLFCGGPPCQPFSIAANQRFAKAGPDFKRIGYAHETRGNLLLHYLDLVLRFRPRVFLVENVVGLQTIDGGAQLQDACDLMSRAGYAIHGPQKVEASDYGVPQRRERLLIVGTRGGENFLFPQPSGERVPCSVPLCRPMNGAANHITREHGAGSVARYMNLGYRERDHLGRVDRLDPDLPSKTVIAGGTKGGGRSHLHPSIPRTLSVRECARLQTFPESFIFTGPVARQFTQVGNAVPPKLAFYVGDAIMRDCFRHDRPR